LECLTCTFNSSQIRLVSEKDHELREQQRALVRADSPDEADAVRRRRIIYRSKQRGWLEVDLLLGTWAMEYADKLTTQEMDEYELLLEEETIDIFNFVSGKDPLPPHLADLGIIKKLQKYAFSAQINSPMRYAEVKAKANLT
jgi:succinate dehydrogenase assembly factor 2